ncbi:MAG: GNAT family N-acetyltransferase [Cytophagales bacterium]|nr:GNAT family N-acetyltransferase [Armatimonadota bacterium]
MLSSLFRGTALPGRQAAPSERDPFAETLRLVGERVILRPLMIEDAPAMFAYARDSEVTRFLPWEPAATVESVLPFLQDQVSRRTRQESLGMAILLAETGEMIGSTDLMDLRRIRGEGEIGYLLAQPYWGRGLMTEAARMTLECGFGRLKLTRVTAYADAENRGSRRVLEKLGMNPWGSEMRVVHGEDRLYIRYQIRRATWLAEFRQRLSPQGTK